MRQRKSRLLLAVLGTSIGTWDLTGCAMTHMETMNAFNQSHPGTGADMAAVHSEDRTTQRVTLGVSGMT